MCQNSRCREILNALRQELLKGNKGLEKVYLKRKPTCSAFQKWLSFGVELTWILIIWLRNRSKSPPSWNTGRHIGSEE